uniref:Uncharacterized protein n=1 Tax=Arundo donax TaxID=35708 RepID=A0A0A9APE6_ARUDO
MLEMQTFLNVLPPFQNALTDTNFDRSFYSKKLCKYHLFC